MAEHKHAAVLRAIADKGLGAAQWQDNKGGLMAPWHDCDGFITPITHSFLAWRIKPEPKPDVVCSGCALPDALGFYMRRDQKPNLRLVFDGEDPTKLKSAEVLS